jgi:uncharacterized coiled-coil DUF342 family protein
VSDFPEITTEQIVARLRMIVAEPDSLCKTDLHYIEDAADELDSKGNEVARLTAERDEARRELDRLGPLLLHAASEIKKVCAERDEARREVCNLSIHPPRDYALERGWFCFKENP